MTTHPDYFKSLAQQQKKNQLKSFKVIINRFFFHWPVFVIAVAFSLSIAAFFVHISKPSYLIKATLLIKDDKKNGDPKSDMMNEVGITNSSEGVDNEIEILKSKTLVNKVVQDLQLWTSYLRKDGFVQTDLYKNSPVRLEVLNRKENFDNKVIEVTIKNDHVFLLKEADGKFVEKQFGQSFQASFGTWKLTPTSELSNYVGSKIMITIVDPDATTAAYQKMIDAALSNKLSTSIVLTISDKVAQRGKDVLNSVIMNYNLFAEIDKNDETRKRLEFLDQRIDSLHKNLTISEKGIEGFKSSEGITDITSESKIQLENMQTNDANLNQVNIQLEVINGIENYLNSNRNSDKAPTTLGINDAALSSSIEKLADLQLQHDKLAATLPETNPDFDPINNQIKATKSAIRENVRNIKQSLNSTRAKLQSYGSRFESSIKGMPEKERQYVSIKRQQSSKENLYTFLLQKREEVAVKAASNLTNNRIIDQAFAEPASNPKMMIYAVAILFGIGLPGAIIFLKSKFTNKIMDIDDIISATKIPVVGELSSQKDEAYITIKKNDVSIVSEQIKALRIKLYHLHQNRESGRVTLITSSVSGEGKSFVSANLSVALAFAYKKTVVLELDMRKPKIGKEFGLSPDHKGISDFLHDKATLAEIIQRSSTSDELDIITCGLMTNNPSESLERKQLQTLIQELRKSYDDIIIDSPPIHLISDAAILSRLSDITLYIIRQGFTDKDEIDFINQLEEQNQLHNLHIVFNGINRMKFGYGYQYNEGYYNDQKQSFLASMCSDFSSRFIIR